MRVTVTERDIQKGKRREPGCCPIALAILRVHDEALVLVGRQEVCISSKSYPLPPVARRFVEAFDYQQPVTPFEFDLEKPDADLVAV